MIVTFLHLVVGEMAPKSWAIAHPERSATLLALPMRAFMWVFRPLLRLLNAAATRSCTRSAWSRRTSVAVGHSPDALRHLVEHSANVGALDAQLLGADLRRPGAGAAHRPRPGRPRRAAGRASPADATVGDVREATRRTGHLRILLGVGGRGLTGVVHVRDTLTAPDDAPAAAFGRPVLTLDADTTVHAALKEMRETRNHLAVVIDAGEVIGVVTLADVLRRLFPRGDRAAV